MAQETHVNVNGTWNKVKELYANVSGAWQKVKEVWVNVNGTWQRSFVPYSIPAGTIIPYIGSTIPAGWTRYTGLDGRFLVGAGGAYGVGSTGGSTSFSGSVSTSSRASHSGGTGFASPFGSCGTEYNSNISKGANYSRGGHSHSFSFSGTALDVYRNYIFIQATAETFEVPANGILMSHTNISGDDGLPNIHTSVNRFMRGASSAGGQGGSSTASASYSTTTNGAHNHHTTANGCRDGGNTEYWDETWYSVTSGGHKHTGTISGTLNTRRRYLALWSNTAEAFAGRANMIALWAGSTIPEGWVLCNGANGTPDMRNYFVRVGNTSNMGQAAGNNSFTMSTTTGYAGSHHHKGSNYDADKSATNPTAYHSDNRENHRHTASKSMTIVPPYRALYFIMRLPE